MDNKEFERLLISASKIPEPSDDFAMRIINKTQELEVEENGSLKDILFAIILPRQVLTTAFTLIIGLFLGLAVSSTPNVNDDEIYANVPELTNFIEFNDEDIL